MPSKSKCLRKPPTALKALDVHIVCSEKFREVGQGLQEALSYMFVDVHVSMKITIAADRTGLAVNALLTLQNKIKRSCRIIYYEEDPIIPPRSEIIRRIYDFILMIQLEKQLAV